MPRNSRQSCKYEIIETQIIYDISPENYEKTKESSVVSKEALGLTTGFSWQPSAFTTGADCCPKSIDMYSAQAQVLVRLLPKVN